MQSFCIAKLAIFQSYFSKDSVENHRYEFLSYFSSFEMEVLVDKAFNLRAPNSC